jgi:uroporphyrinogen decarboxylase
MLPTGMKIIFSTRGILETTMDLLGHEKICYLIYDDPELVAKVFNAVGERFLRLYELVVDHPVVGAITYCDDMGFKTQPLLSPEIYRQYLFPWHKKINEMVHQAGKRTILHACGNLDLIMEDIIACGWDAKQSFEDCIEPVWTAREKYGNRIALLGGFDIDKLSRMDEAQVREHTRMLMERCRPGGGWALGTGNSVPAYIPVRNFLAMVDESRKC